MKSLRKIKGEAELAVVVMLGLGAAWLTHVVTCFQDERWGFLVAGAIFFPIAIVHGIGLWFGFW